MFTLNPNMVNMNYQQAIEESGFDVTLPEQDLLESIQTIFSSATHYANFEDTLLKGIFEDSDVLELDSMKKLLARQRDVILTESSIQSSPEAMSFAVAAFPMLIDLYAEPMLTKVITVYPYDKPYLTIPRVKWIAIHVDEYSKTTEYEYPTATKNLRLNVKTVSLNQNDNVYAGLQRIAKLTDPNAPLLSASEFRISNRNIRITKLKGKTTEGSTVTPFEFDTFGIIDAKGNFFLDDVEVGSRLYRVQGAFVQATGRFTFGVTEITPAAVAASLTDETTIDELEFQFKLFGNGINKAVMRTKPLMSTVEIQCDLEESWEISEIEEILQDWKALWNMDILSLLKDHIKDQMKLNKDAEIADLLYGNIPACKKYGMFREFDLTAFMQSNGVGAMTRPTNVMDIFKNIYPIFIDLIDQMRKRIKMEPRFIVCGTKAGSVLKSLQQFETSLVGQVGEIWQVKGVPSINKFEIIVSDAVEEDLIYLIVKNEQYNLSTILEVTYKPLYVIVETTNSKRRTFIKSRGWIGIVRNEGIATIKIKNFNQYFGING